MSEVSKKSFNEKAPLESAQKETSDKSTEAEIQEWFDEIVLGSIMGG